MLLWQRLIQNLGFPPQRRKTRLSLHADEPMLASLQLLAQREQRSREDVAVDLLNQAILQRQDAETYLHRWETLSPREQQVAALVCLNYTNPQIASLLNLSPETIKTHVRNVLTKFGMSRKLELRRALEDWDFTSWANLPGQGFPILR